MSEDIRVLLFEIIAANPGITAPEIKAMYPNIRPNRVTKVLQRLADNWGDVERVQESIGHRRFRYYPAGRQA